ncbi:uncharacterized protein LOC114582100 [Podarcis muralis]
MKVQFGILNVSFCSFSATHSHHFLVLIPRYGIKNIHYAVAIRLDHACCIEPTPTILETVLPRSKMQQMKNALDHRNGIYVPKPIGDVIAARPRFTRSKEHAEWRLLTGGQNSPVERILSNKDQNSCLIFFSKLSPCVERCLNESDARNIVQMVNPLFNRYSEDSRAFVFETVYVKDTVKEHEAVVGAWEHIQGAPLFRCYSSNRGCIKCFDDNQSGDRNPCLGDEVETER